MCSRADHTRLAEHPNGIGQALLDRDLRYVVVGQAFAQMSGRAPHEHLGRTPREVWPATRVALELLARAGVDEAPRHEVLADPARRRQWLARYRPCRLPDGRPGVEASVAELGPGRPLATGTAPWVGTGGISLFPPWHREPFGAWLARLGDAPVVGLEGEIDLLAARMEGELALRLALAGVSGEVVLDVGGVAFIDLSGLDMVIDLSRRLRGGGPLALRRPRDGVRRLVAALGIGARVEVVEPAAGAGRPTGEAR